MPSPSVRSVTTRRSPSGRDFDLELAGRGGVDAVEDLAEGGLLVDGRAAGNDRREVDLALGAVAERVVDVVEAPGRG